MIKPFVATFVLFLGSGASAEPSAAVPPDCYTCGLPLSRAHETAGGDDPCEDLFNATCLDQNHKPKFKGVSRELDERLATVIDAARDKTARVWGFESFDDGLRKRLAADGFAVLDEPGSDDWPAFKTGERDAQFEVERIFKDSKSCHAEQAKLKKTPNIEAKKVFEKKYADLTIHAESLEFAYFFNHEIAEKCAAYDGDPEIYPAKDNPKIASVCDQGATDLKRKALELFRHSDDVGNQKAVENFVRANQLPELRRHDERHSEEKTVCGRFDEMLQVAAQRDMAEFSTHLVKAKSTIETLIDQFYSAENKAKVSALFDVARKDALSVVLSFVTDPTKRESIAKHYQHLNLHWLKKPDAGQYETDTHGHLILNDKTLPLDSDLATVFNDPSLNYFRELNAEYATKSAQGVVETQAGIDIQPAFLYFLKDHEYWAFGTALHETGHPSDPVESRYNGFDLREELSGVLCCFRRSDSIHMQDNQEAEVTADYIMGESLAIETKKLPPEKRRQGIMSAMEEFCVDDDETGFTINPTEEHPESLFRLFGIVGANPRIRELLNCAKPDSLKVKTCAVDRPATCEPKKDNADLYDSHKEGEGSK